MESEMEEVIVTHSGAIRKIDGVLSNYNVTVVKQDLNEVGDLRVCFFTEHAQIPMIARLIPTAISGGEADSIRSALLKSITYHLYRGNNGGH